MYPHSDFVEPDGSAEQEWSDHWIHEELACYIARDPVCDRVIDKRDAPNTMAALVHGTEMRALYFCSIHCKQRFEHDPQRYGYAR